MDKWKTLESEYVFRRPWLTARRDKVMLPDGRVNDEFYILEYPTWINVMARTRDDRFVMVEQYRHGLDDIFVELCAGVVEENETPLEGAMRELKEETGYGGGEWSLQMVISGNPSVTNNLTYCFFADGVELEGKQQLDSTEDINVKLFTVEELYGMLARDEMKQSLMAAPLWRWFALNGIPEACR